MASRAPVFSPTEIMCTTIGGKTGVAFSGSDSVPPAVTCWRACITAFSTTRLPAERAVMSRPSRMGTPEEIRVPSVRVKRATATLRISMPMTGTFSAKVSITGRDQGAERAREARHGHLADQHADDRHLQREGVDQHA